MPNAISSAWIALRRPAVLWTTLGAIGMFAVVSTVLRFTTAVTRITDASASPGPDTVTLASLAHADGLVSGLQNATTFLGVIAVTLGAFVFATDYQTGIIRTLLTRQPRRLVLVAGKFCALALLLLAAAAAATVATAATAYAIAGSQGVDTSAWELGQVGGAFGRTAVVLVGFGFFGSALGLILRSSVAAIGIGVGWVFAVEQILGGAIDDLKDVLPGQVLSQIADSTAGAAQFAVLAAYIVVAAAIGARLMLRRDVTA